MHETHFHCCIRPLNPENNRFLQKWDAATGLALIFVCFVSPYEVAFMSTDGGGYNDMGSFDFLFWINRLIDLLFIVDMVLQFFLMYPVRHKYGSFLISNQKIIAQHYLKTWFAIDFISVLPFDLIGLFLQSGDVSKLKILRVVRLLRLLKLARLLRSARMIKRWETDMGLSYRKMTMFGLLVTVCIAAHWISCYLGIINSLQGDVCHGSIEDSPDCIMTWFSPAATEFEVTGTPLTAYNNYVVALYVAATVIVHPHALPPKNDHEYIPFIIMIFVGGFIWTRVISRSTAIITSLDRHRIHYHQTMDDLNKICIERGLPRDLRRTLRIFFMNTRNCSEDQTWDQILGRMSPALRTKVLYQTSKDWICRVPLLAGTSQWFLQEVTLHLKHHQYSKNETFGDNWHMYILRIGLCNWSKGEGKICLLEPGCVWGEEHLVLTQAHLLRPNTTRSINFAEVLSLHRKEFHDVCFKFPDYQRTLRRRYIWFSVIRSILVNGKNKMGKREKKSEIPAEYKFEEKSQSFHELKEKEAKSELKRISEVSKSKSGETIHRIHYFSSTEDPQSFDEYKEKQAQLDIGRTGEMFSGPVMRDFKGTLEKQDAGMSGARGYAQEPSLSDRLSALESVMYTHTNLMHKMHDEFAEVRRRLDEKQCDPQPQEDTDHGARFKKPKAGRSSDDENLLEGLYELCSQIEELKANHAAPHEWKASPRAVLASLNDAVRTAKTNVSQEPRPPGLLHVLHEAVLPISDGSNNLPSTAPSKPLLQPTPLSPSHPTTMSLPNSVDSTIEV